MATALAFVRLCVAFAADETMTLAAFHAAAVEIHHSTRNAQTADAFAAVAAAHPGRITVVIDAVTSIPAAEQSRAVTLSAETEKAVRHNVGSLVRTLFTADATSLAMLTGVSSEQADVAVTFALSLAERLSVTVADSPAGTRVSVAGTRTALSDAVASGRLPAGTTLHGSGDHSDAECTVVSDDNGVWLSVAGDEKRHTAPSSAWCSAAGVASGNGWDLFRIGGTDGEKLDTVRR